MAIDEMRNSYRERLQRYADRIDDLETLRQALVEAQWNDELDQDLKDDLARIDLFALELAEGLRPENELREEIQRFLSPNVITLSTYQETLVTITSTASETLTPLGRTYSVDLVRA